MIYKSDEKADLFASRLSITELEELINTLKLGSSPGEDGIHNIFLKKRPRQLWS